MTDELRDYTTPPGWTRADTDRLIDAALARGPWDDDTAFLPLDPAEAERQHADMNRVGRTLTQAQLDKFLNDHLPVERPVTSIVFPRDPNWQPPGQITINPTPTPGRILAQVRNQFWGEVHTARQDRLGRVCRAFQLPEAFRDHLTRLELQRAGVPYVGPDWYQRRPVGMICYSDHVIDTLMQRPDRYTWLAQYLERYGESHPKPSPRAYALAHGLRGAAADMFAEIATAIQEAKAHTPW